MNPDKKNQQNKAEESKVGYKKRITFFDSVEEMNEDQYQQYAKMTPEERLETVYKMRNAIWPENPTKPYARHIHIKK